MRLERHSTAFSGVRRHTAIRTVDSYLDDEITTPRFVATLFSAFGGIAVLIGAG
jgi:hypothetical protein